MKYNPYSSSKLVVAGCPYRFERTYISKNIKGPKDTPRTRKGSVIHECYEEMIRNMADGKVYTPAETEALVTKKLIEHRITETPLIALCQKAVSNLNGLSFPKGISIDMLVDTEEMLAIKRNDDNSKFVQCEWDDPEAYFRGKIDVLFVDKAGFGVFIDHKTQLNIESDSGTFQMSCYAFLVMACYPELEGVKSIIHYADPTINFFQKPYEFTSLEIKETENEIRYQIEVLEAVSDGKFEQVLGGTVCNYCPISFECELWQSTPQELRPILTAIDANKAAQILVVVEKNLAILKKQLRTFVEFVNSGVVANGVEFSFKPSVSWDCTTPEDLIAIVDILEDAGYDPKDYTMLNMKALKKTALFLKKDPVEAIREHLTRKCTTRYSKRILK